MKVTATFNVETSVDVEIEVDEDELDDWRGPAPVTAQLVRDFITAHRDFPETDALHAIDRNRPRAIDSYVTLERVKFQ